MGDNTAQQSWKDTAAQENDASASDPLKIIIVGAGIGGLAASIALRQAGHVVEVRIIFVPGPKFLQLIAAN